MKILFWNKVTCKVSIKIKIILNEWGNMIIFSKNKQVFWINMIEFEVKSRRFNEKLDIWILFRKQLKTSIIRVGLSMEIWFWNKGTCRVSIKYKIILNGCVVMNKINKNNSSVTSIWRESPSKTMILVQKFEI